MSTTTILTTLNALFDFDSEPVSGDASTVWCAEMRSGITLSEDNLPDTIEALLPTWASEALDPWILWSSPEEHAFLLLNPEDGSIELRLHDSLRDFEEARSLTWLASR